MENTKGHQFLFRPENYQKGKLKISFKYSTLLIWNRLEKIHILLGSKKKKVSVKTSFSLNRNQFSLTLNPSVKLKCTKINESPHQKNKNHSTSLNVPSS